MVGPCVENGNVAEDTCTRTRSVHNLCCRGRDMIGKKAWTGVMHVVNRLPWTLVCKQNTVDSLKSAVPSGHWMHPTHKMWEWYLIRKAQDFTHVHLLELLIFVPAPGLHKIGSGMKYM